MSYKLNHREIGEGPILVLLHGFGGSVMHWDSVVENLKQDYRVVIPSISHLFLSQDKIFFSVQIEGIAKFLKENFPQQKINLAGTSYGGALAWALAVQYPDLVDQLVLINPMVPYPGKYFVPPEIRYFCVTPWTEKGIKMSLATPIGQAVIRKLIAAFRDERTLSHARSQGLAGKKLDFVAHLVHRFTWILHSEDWKVWEDKISKCLRKPISMLIFDEQDYLFSEPTYHAFAKTLGCVKVAATSGGGHLTIKTKSQEICQLIREFIKVDRKSRAA